MDDFHLDIPEIEQILKVKEERAYLSSTYREEEGHGECKPLLEKVPNLQ